MKPRQFAENRNVVIEELPKPEAMKHLRRFSRGMREFVFELTETERCYRKILEYACKADENAFVVKITDKDLLESALRVFGPKLEAERAGVDLSTLYDVALHQRSGAVIVANKGATLFTYSPLSMTPSIVRHIGLTVLIPALGIEVVNVGISGNIYSGRLILRSESACTPSFLFGSQRCNCAHQWDSVRELAARLNSVREPEVTCADAFERWVQTQFSLSEGRHLPANDGPGFLMLHIDSQNGMGSGASPGVLALDLYSRAALRHRGEYSAEQIHDTTMAGGFRALGINPDPRADIGGAGYQVTPIVLDYLEASKEVALLSNNVLKIAALQNAGYEVSRLKSLGVVNIAGAKEARERGTEFSHLDICAECVSADEELKRLEKEVQKYWRARK